MEGISYDFDDPACIKIFLESSMANLRYTFRSLTLAMDIPITIIIPANYHFRNRKIYKPGIRFQTMYLMHGGGEDDTSWLRRTRIEEYAEHNDLLIVCPSVHKSLGMNTAYGANYEDFLTKELPEVMQCFFPAALTREDTFIAGQGAGAGAALSLALKHPELYSFCAALTPGIGAELSAEHLAEEMKTIPNLGGIFGTDPAYLEANDLKKAAEAHIAGGSPIPRYYISVSNHEMDAIRDTVYRQVRILREIGYEICFEEVEGMGHDYLYCDCQIRRVIEEMLPLKKKPLYPADQA